jgi:hypothetical protein
VAKIGRTVVVRLRVNKAAKAQVRVLRGARRVVAATTSLKAGANVKRVRVPARAKGRHVVQVVVTDGAGRRAFLRRLRL